MHNLEDTNGVSVGIVTHNSEGFFKNLFACLQTLTINQPTEVIFVDNMSYDQTTQLISDFKTKMTNSKLIIRLVNNTENNIASARNKVIQASKYNKVAFIDSDCQFSKSWLEDLVYHFEQLSKSNKLTAAYSGVQRLPNTNSIYQSINIATTSVMGNGASPQAVRQKKIKSVNHVPCTNVIFDKQKVVSVNGFDPFFALAGEDRKLSQVLTYKNYGLYQGPTPEIINECALNFTDWCKRMFRFGFIQPFLLNVSVIQIKQLHIPTLLWFIATVVFAYLLLNPKDVFIFAIVYFAALFIVALRSTIKAQKTNLIGQTILIIFSTHIFYFFGFSAGVFNRLINFCWPKSNTKHSLKRLSDTFLG